jgi:hypothetical protein
MKLPPRTNPLRNRVRELRTVLASDLEQHPGNWRAHNQRQKHALRAMLDEVGMATAVIAYEHNGRLRIIDGHLRTDLAENDEIPVLVLDVDEAEASKLLLTLDPISAMASTDRDALAELLAVTDLPRGAAAIETLLAKSLETAEELLAEKPEVEIPIKHQVVTECDDEAAQRELYDSLTEQGYRCQLLTT